MKNAEYTIQTQKRKIITIDCNVLLLLVIGSLGKNHIEKFKRTSMFSASDYNLLTDLIKGYTIIVTPNILTEASNLLESYNPSQATESLHALKRFLSKVNEKYFTSLELSGNNCFLKFGLADSSVYELSKKGVVAITTDSRLYSFLVTQGHPVINFNFYKNER